MIGGKLKTLIFPLPFNIIVNSNDNAANKSCIIYLCFAFDEDC